MNQPYRKDVQGLRAAAVIAVVLYHAGGLLPGGFVGVDIFFVISGFVITRSLSQERARTSRIDVRRFYRRRVRRLAPALALTVITVVPLAVLLGPLGGIEAARRTGLAVSLLSANIYLSRGTGYFSVAAELNPLLHTWSLSVEEQFYLGFPLAVAAVYWLEHKRGRRRMGTALLAATVLSFALAVYLAYGPGIGAFGHRLGFMMMPSRAWQFGAGALLAHLTSEDDHRFSGRAGAAIGLVLIVLSFTLVHDNFVYPAIIALVPTAGALLVLANPGRPGVRLLEHPAPVRMGDVSYSWYLWHWPIMVFADASGIDSRVALAAIGLSTLAIASVTYDRVELAYRGARSHNVRDRDRWLMITGVSILAAALAFAISVAAGHQSIRLPMVGAAAQASAPHIDLTCTEEQVAPGLLGCRFGASDRLGSPREVVLIGDSNAGHFAEAVLGAAENLALRVTVVTSSACLMLDVETLNPRPEDVLCADKSARVRTWLREAKPDILVVAHAADIYLQVPERAIRRGPLGGAKAYEAGLRALIEEVLPGGTAVLLVHPVPKFTLGDELRGGPEGCSAALLTLRACAGLEMPRSTALARRAPAVLAELREAGRAGAEVLDVFDELCPGTRCTERNGELWQYRDPKHISVAASRALAPRFEAVFARMVARRLNASTSHVR